MKKYLVTGLAVALVLLGGCADKAKKKSTSASSTTTSSTNLMHTDGSGKKVKTATTESTKKETAPAKAATPAVKTDTALWNSDKKVKLQQFMATWGTSMNQSYREYDNTGKFGYYGVSVPQQTLDGSIFSTIGGERVTISWSPDGVSGEGYKLVDVYSDAETDPDTVDLHLYYFTIINNEPKVLVSLSKGYYERNYLEFAETQNTDLKNGFAEIVGSTSATTTAPVQKPTYEPMHVDGYTDDEVIAAQVWLYCFADENGDYQGDPFEFELSHNAAGAPVAPVAGSVNFPVATMYLAASPLSYSTVCFSNNGDGTAKIYGLPSHYQASRYLDETYGKTFTQGVLDKAQTVTLKNYSQAQLMVILSKMKLV